MKIEVLFPEFCNLFGDAYNMVYLEKTLPEAEFIRTKFSDDVRFTEEKMDLVYMGPMTERMQEQVIRKLMPLKEKIQKAIDDGTVFLFTGNALEIFGDYIENEDGSRVECLGLYRLYAKRNMMHRHNSDFEGEFDGNVIMGFKTQFTMAYTPDESHGLFVKNKGVGLNIKAKYEGIRVNNFFGTYLVGPILVLNPPFTKYILNLMGAGDVALEAAAYGAGDYAALFAVIASTVLLLTGMIAVLSAFAKTVKEASMLVMPLMIVSMLVGVTSMFGDVHAQLGWYCIPLYNSVQCMSGVLAFSASAAAVGVTVAVNLALAACMTLILRRLFNSESVMFSR